MFKLTQKQKADSIEYEGHTIYLNLTFDTILKCLELKEDDFFNEMEKIVILFRLLVKDWKQYKTFNVYDRQEVVSMAFEKVSDRPSSYGSSSDVESFHFVHDAERIYASFLQDYDMDLTEQQGKLSWQKFIGLFNSLSDDSPIMKAIQYRLMDVPPASKVGKEEHTRLKKLKKAYELPSQKKAREEALLKAMEQRKKQLQGRR